MCDKAQLDSKLTVSGKQIEQVMSEGDSNKLDTTKAFASQSSTAENIHNYAQSLAGDVPLKEISTSSGTLYIAPQIDGSTIKLRNSSRSSDQTQARWTIEIESNKNVTNGVGENVKRVELKFR